MFIDPRLELAEQKTFETYVRVEHMLNQGRSGWAEPLRRMGEPLVLLDHNGEIGAEATLLAAGGWRLYLLRCGRRQLSIEDLDWTRSRVSDRRLCRASFSRFEMAGSLE